MDNKYFMEDRGNTAGSASWGITPSHISPAPGQWGTLEINAYSYDLEIWNKIKRENGEMVKGTRQLYNVFVVDPVGDGEVVFRNMEVIALDEESAIRKTVSSPEFSPTKDLDDYDIIVQNLCDWGSIRPKV